MIVPQNRECCNSREGKNMTIDEEYVVNQFANYTHACVILGESPFGLKNKPYIGDYRLLKAFMMFRYIEDNGEKIFYGISICCDKRFKGYGKYLLQYMKDLAIENGVKRWIINSLNEPTLIDYYKRFGFIPIGERDMQEGSVKTLTMKMFFGLNNEIDDFDYSRDDGNDYCFEKQLKSLDELPLKEYMETKEILYGKK